MLDSPHGIIYTSIDISSPELKQNAEQELKLATCGGPPYYYKVAYDEAVTMLESLKV